MEDVERCGNIMPKFPGGPQQGGLVSRVILTATIIPALMGGLRLDPEPTPWNVQGGIAR